MGVERIVACAPGTPSAPYRALSAPTFAPERNEIWYTDGNYGFFALRLR